MYLDSCQIETHNAALVQTTAQALAGNGPPHGENWAMLSSSTSYRATTLLMLVNGTSLRHETCSSYTGSRSLGRHAALMMRYPCNTDRPVQLFTRWERVRPSIRHWTALQFIVRKTPRRYNITARSGCAKPPKIFRNKRGLSLL